MNSLLLPSPIIPTVKWVAFVRASDLHVAAITPPPQSSPFARVWREMGVARGEITYVQFHRKLTSIPLNASAVGRLCTLLLVVFSFCQGFGLLHFFYLLFYRPITLVCAFYPDHGDGFIENNNAARECNRKLDVMLERNWRHTKLQMRRSESWKMVHFLLFAFKLLSIHLMQRSRVSHTISGPIVHKCAAFPAAWPSWTQICQARFPHTVTCKIVFFSTIIWLPFALFHRGVVWIIAKMKQQRNGIKTTGTDLFPC